MRWNADGYKQSFAILFSIILLIMLILLTSCLTYVKKKKRKDDLNNTLVPISHDINEKSDDNDNNNDYNKLDKLKIVIKNKMNINCCIIYGIISIFLLCLIWLISNVVIDNIFNEMKDPKSPYFSKRSWSGHDSSRTLFYNQLNKFELTNNNILLSGDLHQGKIHNIIYIYNILFLF